MILEQVVSSHHDKFVNVLIVHDPVPHDKPSE